MVETADLRVTDARVVTPSGIVEGGVAVDDGTIVKIGTEANLPEASEEVNADGKHLIPGFVDPHNHMGLMGGAERESYQEEFKSDMETETRAALYGGTTTLLTFLLQTVEYSPDMDYLVNAGNDQSYIDFGFHAIIHKDEHYEEMERLAEEWDVRSFKLFFNMYKKTAPEFGIEHANAGDVYKVLKKASDIDDAVVMFHAENDDLATVKQEELQEEGRDGLEAWADSSPGICQAMQIEQIGMLTDHTDASSYVVHNTMKETILSLKRYQDQGVKLYGEVLASMLINDCTEDLGNWGKISPPVGYPEDKDALWKGLRTGVLQHVGTDHCPNDYERIGERDRNIWERPPGDIGLETFLPVMLSEGINKDRISIERMVEVCAENNAKRFGIYPRKGALVEGTDADMVIIDLDKSAVVDDDFLHGREDRWSSLHGKELTGLPTHVFKGGELAVRDGELLVEPGIGEYLPRHEG